MDPSRPAVFSLHFGRAFRISDAGEIALEDYARVLAVAERAETVREASPGHATALVVSTASFTKQSRVKLPDLTPQTICV